jgi:hypothetical protein
MRDHRRFSYVELTRFYRPAVVAAALAAAALLTANLAAAKPREEMFKLRAAISLPNGAKINRFDISWVDPKLGEYFLSDSTNKTIDVVNTATNQVVAMLAATPPFHGVGPTFDTTGPNGVLTVDHRYVWAGDYGDGTNGNPVGGVVKVIDLTTGNTVAVIPTGGTARADELCNDPKDHVVMIANPGETPVSMGGTGPYVSFIDTTTYKVLGQIFMNGKNGTPLATDGIEQCQWRRQNDKFYVNIPEVNGPGTDAAPGAVLVINPTTMTIVKTFALDHNLCEGPAGMALGPTPQILLGCGDGLKNVPSTIVIDARNGNVIYTLKNEDGADEVWYNPGDGHYLLARSGGVTGPELGIVDSATGKNDKSLTTRGAAHSVAADPNTLKVFVPIPVTGTGAVCSLVGGDDSDGCIAVYKAGPGTNEGL